MATINDIARESARIQALGPNATAADIQAYQNLYSSVYNAPWMGSGLMDPRQLMDMANKLGANITMPRPDPSTAMQGDITGTNPDIGFGLNGGPTPAPYQAPPTGGLLDPGPGLNNGNTGGAGTPSGPGGTQPGSTIPTRPPTNGGFPPGVDPNNPFPPITNLPSPPAPTNPGPTVPYPGAPGGPTRPGLPTPGNPGGQPVFGLPPGYLSGEMTAYGYTGGPNGEVLPVMLQGGWSPHQQIPNAVGNSGFASQQTGPMLPQMRFNPEIGQYEYWQPPGNPPPGAPPAAGTPPGTDTGTTPPGTTPPGTGAPPEQTDPGRYYNPRTGIRYQEKGLLGMPQGYGGGGGLLGAAIPPALMGLLK